jgi:hypothetical protein
MRAACAGRRRRSERARSLRSGAGDQATRRAQRTHPPASPSPTGSAPAGPCATRAPAAARRERSSVRHGCSFSVFLVRTRARTTHRHGTQTGGSATVPRDALGGARTCSMPSMVRPKPTTCFPPASTAWKGAAGARLAKNSARFVQRAPVLMCSMRPDKPRPPPGCTRRFRELGSSDQGSRSKKAASVCGHMQSVHA